MDCINRRYQVIDHAHDSSPGLCYLVEDLLQEGKRAVLRILSPETVHANVVNHLKKELPALRNLTHPGIVHIYDFGTVQNIDGHRVLSRQYYLTHEYIPPSKGVLEACAGWGHRDIADIAVELCHVLGYLHAMGYVYGRLDHSCVVVMDGQADCPVKLTRPVLHKDVESAIFKPRKVNMQFVSPDSLGQDLPDAAADLYSLGVLLLFLITGADPSTTSTTNLLEESRRTGRLGPFSSVIDLLLAPIGERCRDTRQVVARINKAMGTDYPRFDRSVRDRVVSNTKLVGRETELRQLDEWKNQFLRESRGAGLTLVSGSMGMGKTYLLREFAFYMELEKVKVFFGGFSDDRQITFDPISQLIRNMIPFASSETIAKYGPELIKIVPDLRSTTDIQPTPALPEEREIQRLNDRIASFIFDTFERDQVAIVLDNAQWASKRTLELIDRILNVSKAVSLWIILVYRKEEVESGPIRHLIDKWQSRPGTTQMTLSAFGFQETMELIRQMLGTGAILPKLAARIVRETEGSPLLTKDIINTLHAQKHLILGDDGEWYVDFDIDGDHTKLPLPGSVYEAALDQIETLADDARAILKLLSVFAAPAPLETIQGASGIPRDRITEILADLIALQLADERVGDAGYAYDIHLKGIKRSLYDSMDEAVKRELHARVAEALESLPNRDDMEISYELIHHLVRAGQPQRALESALASAESLFGLGIDSHALTFLQEAYRVATDLGADDETTEILLMLGETHERMGDYEKALATYQEALRLASKRDDVKAKALAKQGIGLLQVQMNSLVAGSSSLYEALRLAESAGFAEGILRASYSLCVMMLIQQRYNEAIELASKCLQTYTDSEFVHLHALFENTIGACCDSLGRSEDAIARYKSSIELFNRAGRSWETLRPINNIGKIYNEHRQDPITARKYFEEALAIARKHSQPYTMATILNNLGETHRVQDEYSRALELYLEAERICLEAERRRLLFVCRLNILISCVFLGEYQKSYDYMLLGQQDIQRYHSDLGRYIASYHRYAARLFYELGDFELALACLAEATKAQPDLRTAYNLDSRSLEVCVNFERTGRVDYDQIDRLIEEYRGTGYVKDRRDWLHAFARVLIDSGDCDKAGSLLDESEGLRDRCDTARLAGEMSLLRALLAEDEDRAAQTRRSLELCRRAGDPLLEFRAHKAVGDALYTDGDMAGAVRAYTSALDLLYRLTARVPRHYRRRFLLSHRRRDVRDRMLAIRRAFLEGEHVRTLSEENRDLAGAADPLGAFFSFMDPCDPAGREVAVGLAAGAAGPTDTTPELLKDMLGSFTSNDQHNLDLLLSALAKATGADVACVFLEEDEGLSLLCCQGTAPDPARLQHILDYVRVEQEGILISERLGGKHSGTEMALPDGASAVICIPLVEAMAEEPSYKGEQRRPRSKPPRDVLGYLYLSCSSVFNNLDQRTFCECEGFAGIAKLLLENHRLRITSSIDKVSGVYTRKFFEQAITSELSRAAREKYPLSVIMIDIDDFKNVNDRYGHQTGDEVLRSIGKTLTENIRPRDICCRYGGEEFVVLLPDTPADEAELVAERLRMAIESAKLMGACMPLTVSLGVSSYPIHGEWPDELVTRADQALYWAKEAGRNRTSVWNPSIGSAAKRTDRLAGIVTGNTVQDQRNVLAIVEIFEMIDSQVSVEEKMYLLLGKSMSVFDAEWGAVILKSEDGTSERVYARKRLVDGWVTDARISRQLIDEAMCSGTSRCTIDWDSVYDIDPVSGNPIWHSAMICPIKKRESTLGVLCLSAPISRHEYGSSELNFADTLASMAALLIE